MKVGKVTFNEAYKAVSDYRIKYPDKAVIYSAENYPDLAWAVFMAGGSCPVLPIVDKEFLKAAAQMNIEQVNNDTYKKMVKYGLGIIIYSQSEVEIPIQLEKGKYALKFIDSKTGEEKTINKSISGGSLFSLKIIKNNAGAYWFQKL